MLRISMTVCLAGALLCGEARAGKLYQFMSRGRHYQITTDVDRKLAKKIAEHMELVYAEYDRRLSAFHTRDSRAMPLYVLSTRAKYKRIMRSNFGINAANTSGMFFVNERGPMLATWVQGQSRTRLFATLRHEGFHQFAWVRIGQDLPPWANEGLARYFGDAIVVRGKFRTGLASGARVRHIQAAIKNGEHIGFRELLNMPTEEWGNRVIGGNSQTALQYDQAWSIVHFLINAKRGKYAGPFIDYLKLISKGFVTEDAFSRAFGTRNYDKFEAVWKRYMLELKPDPVSTAVRRLHFLSAGLKQLHERGIAVTSLEQLKQKLQAGGFGLRYIEHGGVVTVSADDDSNFEAPQPEKARKPATLTFKLNRKKGLPPVLAVEGLKPSPRVKWSLDQEGNLVDEIVFK